MDLSTGGLECEVARRVECNLVGAGDFQLDPARICSRSEGKIVFQLLMTSVIDQINPWVNILVANPGIDWNIGVPLSGISTDEVIHPALLLVFSDHGRILRGPEQLELQDAV